MNIKMMHWQLHHVVDDWFETFTYFLVAMEFNTQTYSDKNFWFLRGIEDEVYKTPDPCGQLIEIDLNYGSECSQNLLKPQSIIFLGTDKHLTAILSLEHPNQLFLFTGTNYKFLAIIDFFDYSISDICNIKHEVYLLVDKSKILQLNLLITELNTLIAKKASSSSDDEPLKLLYNNFQFKIFSITGLNPSIDTRIVAWTTHRLTSQILAWQLNSSEIWISEAKKDCAVFKETTLGIPKHLFQSIKVSKCYYHEYSKCVYLTDDGGGRVLSLLVSEEKLRAKIIIGDGHKRFQIGRAENARFISPYGITVFDFYGNEYKQLSSVIIFKNELTQEKSTHNKINKQKTLLENSFLIVIDKDAKLAITVCIPIEKAKFNRDAEVLPLLGSFLKPNIKQQLSNLASYPLKFAQNVTRGPSGCLLFWCEGNSNICILDPGFQNMFKVEKPKITTMQFAPDT